MAPGTVVGQRQSSTIQVAVSPKAEAALAALKELQPSLKHLTTVWISPSSEIDVRELRRAAKGMQIELRSEKLSSIADLPGLLRQIQGKTDALWLPTDPLLVTAQTLVILSKFSADAKIPLYSSVAGMAERGATATVSVNYLEVGRTTGRTAKSILEGGSTPFEVYPDRVEVVINLPAAQNTGLNLSSEMLSKAQKVIR
jgi:putative ABC transport system substrate-binding protein